MIWGQVNGFNIWRNLVEYLYLTIRTESARLSTRLITYSIKSYTDKETKENYTPVFKDSVRRCWYLICSIDDMEIQ